MDLSLRLKRARKHAKLTQTALAALVNVEQPLISQIENGTTLKSAHMAKIAHACGVNPLWLSEGIGEMVDAMDRVGKATSDENVISGDFSRSRLRNGELSIPQFNVRGAMGSGQLPADYVEIIRHVTMHKSHLEMLGVTYSSPENLAIMTGWGQSMKGTINHGEPVIVDRGIVTFIGDGVYAFTWDGLVYLKRLQKESKTHFRIISDNRNHDPISVPIGEVIIHARALVAWNANKL